MRSLLAIILALVVVPPAQAGVTFLLNPVAVEGDNVAGVGNITTIDNLAVNDPGTWLVECDTDFANTDQDGVLLRNDAVQLREDQSLAAPVGSRLDTFDSVNLNNAGHSGWNFFLAGTSGLSDDSGIFFDATLVFQEGFISTSPGFTPGTPYIGFFEAKNNDSDELMIVASIDDPAIATTVDRALVRLRLTAAGALISETVLAKEGDLLPGQTETVFDFGTGPHLSAFNDSGDILYFADLNGNTVTDGVLYRNLTLVAQEGGPSVVGGRNYETLSSRAVDLNDVGDIVFKANLDGGTTDDELIVKNGAVFVREGGTLPAIAGFAFTAFGVTTGPVQVDNLGNVLWFGDWNDPDTNKDTGLFWNDQLIIKEGDQIGAFTLDEISNGEEAFKISDDGHWIIFEGTFLGGLSAAIIVEVIDATVPVRISDFAAAANGAGVRLEWHVADPDLELAAVEVERADAEVGPYAALDGGALAPAAHMTYDDASVEAGRPYWYRLVLVGTDGSRSVVGPVQAASAALATALQTAFESPSDGSVRVRYSVARAGMPVTFSVHDVRGRRLWGSVETVAAAGVREARWDRRDASGARVGRGVYFVRMHAGGVEASRKLLLAQP
jgi:hypothetical protein